MYCIDATPCRMSSRFVLGIPVGTPCFLAINQVCDIPLGHFFVHLLALAAPVDVVQLEVSMPLSVTFSDERIDCLLGSGLTPYPSEETQT